MAMRHPRGIVLAGAFLALAVMSILSAVLGHILPALLPRRYTTIAAACLFFVFGAMMLREGLEMQAGNEKIQEELREVQKEVEEAEEKQSSTVSTAKRLEEAEEGNVVSPVAPVSISKDTVLGARDSLTHRRTRGNDSSTKEAKEGVRNLLQLFIHPVLLQTFIMTFLAEWGDRSQISTIALAAAHVGRSSVPMTHAYRDFVFAYDLPCTERVHRHDWNDSRALCVYDRCSPWRQIPSHENQR